MAEFNLEKAVLQKENWKQTRKKTAYTIYMCIPPVGTKIVSQLEGKEYTVGRNDVVLSGTRGELWVERITAITKNYTFADKALITPQRIESLKRVGYLPWTRITPKASKLGSDFAFHVPLKYKNIPLPNGMIINKTGVAHGIGDFLVAENNHGVANLENMWVVNGEVFVDTYDMRAFSGLVVDVKQVVDAPYPTINLLPQSVSVTNIPVEVEEKGHVETDDFNIIAYRTYEFLKKCYDKYDYEIVDVVSNYKQKEKNYAKIDVISKETEKAVARLIISIDKNDFIMLVIKSRLDGKQHTIKVDTMKEMTQAIKQYI